MFPYSLTASSMPGGKEGGAAVTTPLRPLFFCVKVKSGCPTGL